MANQYTANPSLTELVRQHGETLARLTTIVEEDHKDLEELKESTEIIAKAVARQEAHNEFKDKMLKIGIPLVTTLAGVVAGHFIR